MLYEVEVRANGTEFEPALNAKRESVDAAIEHGLLLASYPSVAQFRVVEVATREVVHTSPLKGAGVPVEQPVLL